MPEIITQVIKKINTIVIHSGDAMHLWKHLDNDWHESARREA
nr:hypothetical protein [Delftia acidovorans]